MKFDKLVGDRFKERPSDCVIDSHALMIKGGYMKYVASGIYSQYPILKRISKKIENIIREEMDAIDGQEVLFPVVLPSDLWEESGRYESIGSELLRFTDRNNSKLVLGMTHEEAAVHLVRDYAKSYTKYPFMVYQLQTKFRDEARPRAGMIRVREFTMKDAYSFHSSMKDLEAYYQVCRKAYHKIFARAGVSEVIDVASDSGMMGGSISHEYMLLTPIGEDSIAICSSCDFRSNLEAAQNIVINQPDTSLEELSLVETPHCKTIEAVCNYLNRDVLTSCKAVVFQKNSNDDYVVVFTRGDVEVNETKLRNYLKEEIHPAVITNDSGLHAGFIGPYQITDHCIVLYDKSLEGIESLVCGANQEDYHYIGVNIKRDIGDITYIDLGKIIEGGICPHCRKPTITISRGIEVGNIFQLGTKYTKAMNMQYTDEHGELSYPIMGCYGIGVGRLAASVCEAHHDDCGPIWPITIAPYEVHVCAIRSDDPEVKGVADQFYQDLLQERIEVIYDDRNVRPGVMFADADLLGVPIRVILSPKNLKEGVVEIVMRDKSFQTTVPLSQALGKVKEIITDLYTKYNV